jgi:putative membrane protein
MSLSPPNGAARSLLLIWLLTMISVPILKWVWGERAQQRGIVAGVLLQAATVLTVLLPAWGARRTLLTAVFVIVTGWAAEFLGSSTGFPFGRYHYTDRLQPQLMGVPLVIPLAWLMMLPPAWAVGRAVGGVGMGVCLLWALLARRGGL